MEYAVNYCLVPCDAHSESTPVVHHPRNAAAGMDIMGLGAVPCPLLASGFMARSRQARPDQRLICPAPTSSCTDYSQEGAKDLKLGFSCFRDKLSPDFLMLKA